MACVMSAMPRQLWKSFYRSQLSLLDVTMNVFLFFKKFEGLLYSLGVVADLDPFMLYC